MNEHLLVQAFKDHTIFKILSMSGVKKHELEDVSQDFMCVMLTKERLARFDPSRAKFSTYLRNIARNFQRDRIRSKSRIKNNADLCSLTPDILAGVSDGSKDILSVVLDKMFLEHLQTIPPVTGAPYAETPLGYHQLSLHSVWLLRKHGYPIYEIAQMFGVRPHRIQKYLKEIMSLLKLNGI